MVWKVVRSGFGTSLAKLTQATFKPLAKSQATCFVPMVPPAPAAAAAPAVPAAPPLLAPAPPETAPPDPPLAPPCATAPAEPAFAAPLDALTDPALPGAPAPGVAPAMPEPPFEAPPFGPGVKGASLEPHAASDSAPSRTKSDAERPARAMPKPLNSTIGTTLAVPLRATTTNWNRFRKTRGGDSLPTPRAESHGVSLSQ